MIRAEIITEEGNKLFVLDAGKRRKKVEVVEFLHSKLRYERRRKGSKLFD